MRHRAIGGLLAVLLLTPGCAVAYPGAPPSTAASPTPSPSATPTQLSADGVRLTLYADLAAAAVDAWTGRISRGATVLAQSDLGPLVTQWDGVLPVVLPATAAQYGELAGEDASDAAALTRCVAGSPRIIVNPAMLDADSDYLDSLIIHEGVHVATDAPCGAHAPLWVEEGIAEWVAELHSVSSSDANALWVKAALKADAVPSALPGDEDFRGDPDTVAAAYALAALAVRVAVANLGTDAAMEYFHEQGSGGSADPATTAAITGWWQDELARLSRDGQR